MSYKIPKEIGAIFKNYPTVIERKLLDLRQLILDTAHEDQLGTVEETIKWGQASYLTKDGSTIRIDGLKSQPDKYAIYFHCQSKLVETYKILYPETFIYEGNRAIVFEHSDALPVNELKHCISLALSYHKRKHLPLLGA